MTEWEKELEREDMACLREEERDGMSSGIMSVKRVYNKPKKRQVDFLPPRLLYSFTVFSPQRRTEVNP